MNKIAKNLLFGFGGQALTLAMSMILPRIILVSFGSEINGITATISQIFTYITLLEAGIGNAAVNCLYKNIADDDRAGISETVSATEKYFRRIVPVYTLCILVFAIVYPLVVNTNVSPITICQIILLQGLGGIVNFRFTNTYTQLLVADGRNYVFSNLTLMVKAVATGLQILLISLGFDIVSVQLSLLFAYIIKAIIINVYTKKHYPWLTKIKNADIKILSQRGAFVIHEISTVIFQNTDIFLISVFCSIKEASVYSVYNMVFVALSGITTIFFKGIDFNLGLEYHRDIEKYKKMHDTYETMINCFVFAIISAAYLVMLPFVRLYTAGVTDINYIIPILPVLFSVIQLLSASRSVASKLITISGHAKETIPNTIAETVINLVSSVVFVLVLGMEGVLLGTIVALLYRTNDIILYANIKILKRKPWHAYKTMLLNFVLFAAIVAVTYALPLPIGNYLQFLLWGAISLLATLVCYYGANCVFDRNMRVYLCSIMKTIIHIK